MHCTSSIYFIPHEECFQHLIIIILIFFLLWIQIYSKLLININCLVNNMSSVNLLNFVPEWFVFFIINHLCNVNVHSTILRLWPITFQFASISFQKLSLLRCQLGHAEPLGGLHGCDFYYNNEQICLVVHSMFKIVIMFYGGTAATILLQCFNFSIIDWYLRYNKICMK